MSAKPNGADPVDVAIAAAEQPAPVALEGFNVTIASTGRPMQIAVPFDMTEGELVEVIGWMGTKLAAHLAARRAQAVATNPASRILIPR